MANTFDFSGKKYIVTGAASGMGRATSISLAKSGARLVLLDINKDGLEHTRKMLVGDGHLLHPVNFSEQNDLTMLFDNIVSEMGKLNGFVHCAGIAPVTPIPLLTRDRLKNVMGINFYSFLELVRCISKRKNREDNCSIVEVSSINSIHPEKCMTAYVASKAAANTAVQALAIELAKNKMRINAVLPGIVDTPMAQKAFDEMDDKNISSKKGKQVLGITNPDEIANVILFLLSDLASAITGRIICADGGYLNFEHRND